MALWIVSQYFRSKLHFDAEAAWKDSKTMKAMIAGMSKGERARRRF
jgi:hypothetical protein